MLWSGAAMLCSSPLGILYYKPRNVVASIGKLRVLLYAVGKVGWALASSQHGQKGPPGRRMVIEQKVCFFPSILDPQAFSPAPAWRAGKESDAKAMNDRYKVHHV